jgi:hypothetical protein
LLCPCNSRNQLLFPLFLFHFDAILMRNHFLALPRLRRVNRPSKEVLGRGKRLLFFHVCVKEIPPPASSAGPGTLQHMLDQTLLHFCHYALRSFLYSFRSVSRN